MGVRVELLTRGTIDPNRRGLVSSQPIRVYNIDDDSLTPSEVSRIEGLLADPIVDESDVNKPVLGRKPNLLFDQSSIIEVSPKPGVNDPEGVQAKIAIEGLLGHPIGDVSFFEQYLWHGDLSSVEAANVGKKLGNALVRDFTVVSSADWNCKSGVGFSFPRVDLPEVKPFEYVDINLSDTELSELSNDRMLALSGGEWKAIQKLFSDETYLARRAEIGLRPLPTDSELEGIAQAWSEHCKHKKLNAIWKYTSEDSNDKSGLPHITDSLFKSIIQNATYKILEDVEWIKTAFGDNSGGGLLNENYLIVHKVETHNHPSGLEGFGGAGTGVGGVFRDGKRTGKNMIVVSAQYGFRGPHPLTSFDDLPDDIQTPLQLWTSVVAGVGDYGNKMGIPNMCGQVKFDDGWLKPAIFVGTVAVGLRENHGRPNHIKDIRPGYVAISMGGRVGKDGIHGATGSSTDLAADAEQRDDVNQSVQIGNPLIQKKNFDVSDVLHDEDLIEASQDCGAGGWNSAFGEMVVYLHELEQKRFKIKTSFSEQGITPQSSIEDRLEALGEILPHKVASPQHDLMKIEVESGEIFQHDSIGMGGGVMDLSNVLVKYPGLKGWEKKVSESQERDVIVTKAENVSRVLELCEHYDVEATVLGEFTDTGDYQVLDQDETISFLPIDFLDQGLPQMTIEAHWKPCQNKEPSIPVEADYTPTLEMMIGHPNMQAVNWIRTQFDHEVRGGSIIKPIVGIGRGKSDAIAYWPILGEKEVAVESWGSNPWQGDIDGYHMGKNNVVDAIGRIIAVGGSLRKIMFNGNTTCPKPEKDPAVAATVQRMLKGSADAEVVFGTPRISGKDSTSMERSYISTKDGEKKTVKAKSELLMSALGVAEDSSSMTTPDFKLPGDIVYVVGETKDELGASEFYEMHNVTGRNVPKSDCNKVRQTYEHLEAAIKDDIVHSAQYVCEGGLAGALTNSSIAGDLGVSIELNSMADNVQRADKLLFSRSTGRFVVSVHPSKKEMFESKMGQCYIRRIGEVGSSTEFNISYRGHRVVGSEVGKLREKNYGGIQL